MQKLNLPVKFYSCIVAVFCSLLFQAQQLDIKKLSDKIYLLNNGLQYKKSQDTLIGLLQREDLSPRDHIEVNILLSATYKRLQDYTSVNYYLSKALDIAKENNCRDLYNIINSHFAFSYFDTHDYKKAAGIMEQIANQDYKYLPAEDKSKILMQEGYIRFLDENFQAAEEYYRRASSLMMQDNACDLPIVYGKQIQLYFAENNIAKALEYYRTGVSRAKRCNILKYEMYLAEVMMNTYKERKDADNELKFNHIYDSLSNIYKRTENLQALHLNREIKSKENEEKEKKEKWRIFIIYSLATLVLVFIIIMIVRYMLKLKVKNRENERVIDEMRQLLAEYETEKARNIDQQSKLTSKQQLMLEMIKDGKSNKEIAIHFNITESTVKYHIRNIFEILNIKRRSELR
ncbi:LuxR family transcriptional regulator [uncultured Chryseobacterium sp.]|uniref:LuxR C-terminal-related transcriptional regulator n=1 Tax=uncultured Chryseobacterium sp. TaxID=259322 RepID=UPI0025D20464|nr:LuxR family transcriptional regulator [uncultured Chryseobacterium sp.]